MAGGGVFTNYELMQGLAEYYVRPYAYDMERLMGWLDAEALSHGWPAFEWKYIDSTGAYVVFTPTPYVSPQQSDYVLINSPINYKPFWQQIRTAIAFVGSRLFFDFTSSPWGTVNGTAWNTPLVADYGQYGKLSKNDWFDLLPLMQPANSTFPPLLWDAYGRGERSGQSTAVVVGYSQGAVDTHVNAAHAAMRASAWVIDVNQLAGYCNQFVSVRLNIEVNCNESFQFVAMHVGDYPIKSKWGLLPEAAQNLLSYRGVASSITGSGGFTWTYFNGYSPKLIYGWLNYDMSGTNRITRSEAIGALIASAIEAGTFSLLEQTATLTLPGYNDSTTVDFGPIMDAVPTGNVFYCALTCGPWTAAPSVPYEPWRDTGINVLANGLSMSMLENRSAKANGLFTIASGNDFAYDWLKTPSYIL